jgi:hypothetical protein
VRITQIEIQTDEGARTVKLANFIEVDPTAAEAPDVFCELAIMLWECVRRAAQGRLVVDGGKPS